MDGLTVANVSYVIAILISFFVAGLIQLLTIVLHRFAKETVAKNSDPGVIQPANSSSDEAAVAAVIAIANRTA